VPMGSEVSLISAIDFVPRWITLISTVAESVASPDEIA